MPYSANGNHHQKSTTSTFIKLNKKRGAAKGLGHSTTNKNNFNRRHSVTTQSSSEKGYSYITGDRLLSQPHSHYSHECNGFKGQFDFTEQRYNYECISQQQQERQFHQYDRQTRPSEPVKTRCQNFNSRIPSCTSDEVDGCDPAMLLQRNAVDSQFLALREFRIKNSNECYGHGRLNELPLQLPNNFVQLSANHCPPGELTAGSPSSPMPYALKQSLLRNELARDFSSRIARKDFINSGLNKSLALSYQPMY